MHARRRRYNLVPRVHCIIVLSVLSDTAHLSLFLSRTRSYGLLRAYCVRAGGSRAHIYMCARACVRVFSVGKKTLGGLYVCTRTSNLPVLLRALAWCIVDDVRYPPLCPRAAHVNLFRMTRKQHAHAHYACSRRAERGAAVLALRALLTLNTIPRLFKIR